MCVCQARPREKKEMMTHLVPYYTARELFDTITTLNSRADTETKSHYIDLAGPILTCTCVYTCSSSRMLLALCTYKSKWRKLFARVERRLRGGAGHERPRSSNGWAQSENRKKKKKSNQKGLDMYNIYDDAALV